MGRLSKTHSSPQFPHSPLSTHPRARVLRTCAFPRLSLTRAPRLGHTGRMRLIGYTRVSTKQQDSTLQVSALEQCGVERRDIFSDVITGSRPAVERPQMRNLLAYAQPGDIVVVWRLDRLGRSLPDLLKTVDVLTRRDVGLRSVVDGIDSSTPTGRLMIGLLGTLADYERELIAERVQAGVDAARAGGTRFGRPPTDPDVIRRKLDIVNAERAKGRTAAEAAQLVGWSRATLYRHQKG